jgi:hypothetical protein
MLHGTNAHTALFGEDGDISNLCQYQWYDWCYFREQKQSFLYAREVLRRVLGPSKGARNEMAQWILKANGKIVPRRSSRPLKVDEIQSPTEIKKRVTFDGLIERRWGTYINPLKQTDAEDLDDNEFEEYEDEDKSKRAVPNIEDTVDASTGRLLNQQLAYDKILRSEVSLQLGENMTVRKVTKRDLGPNRNVAYDENPYLNMMIYEVEFPDGQLKEYAANVIAENMLSQVDSDGYSLSMMKAITGYRKDAPVAMPKTDKYLTTPSGQKRIRKTTVGWSLLVKWANGTESWIPLKDLKESNPIETAEFAKA